MSWYDGMDTDFADRLKRFVIASAGRVGVYSGFRTVEEQEELWQQAIIDYGSEDAARNHVAPPGKSNHNHGVAADLQYANDDPTWAHENAWKYGLAFPMSWENWHIEPAGVRDGSYESSVHVDGHLPGDPDSYTNTPAGSMSPVDPRRRFDLGYQLESLGELLRTGGGRSLKLQTLRGPEPLEIGKIT